MTEESQWLLDRCDELVNNSEKYEERAFFQQLKILITEQDRRLTQAKGELDGRIWNPGKW